MSRSIDTLPVFGQYTRLPSSVLSLGPIHLASTPRGLSLLSGAFLSFTITLHPHCLALDISAVDLYSMAYGVLPYCDFNAFVGMRFLTHVEYLIAYGQVCFVSAFGYPVMFWRIMCGTPHLYRCGNVLSLHRVVHPCTLRTI